MLLEESSQFAPSVFRHHAIVVRAFARSPQNIFILPNSCRAAICLPIVGWVVSRSRATTEKLPVSTTHTKLLMWIGSYLGTVYVWSTIFATPKIGAALTLALRIAGQTIAALFLDYDGAIGLNKIPASSTDRRSVLVVLGISLIAHAKREVEFAL